MARLVFKATTTINVWPPGPVKKGSISKESSLNQFSQSNIFCQKKLFYRKDEEVKPRVVKDCRPLRHRAGLAQARREDGLASCQVPTMTE